MKRNYGSLMSQTVYHLPSSPAAASTRHEQQCSARSWRDMLGERAIHCCYCHWQCRLLLGHDAPHCFPSAQSTNNELLGLLRCHPHRVFPLVLSRIRRLATFSRAHVCSFVTVVASIYITIAACSS